MGTNEVQGVFDVEAVERGLEGTRFRGQVMYFPVVASTNTLAIEAAHAGAREGVWVADEQTAGRGRGGHQWHSTPGDGLYLSALVVPSVAPQRALWISLATGLAARKAIEEASGLTADIRWPNDLLLNGRKCGGILVESALSVGTGSDAADAVRFAVIGVGINVNHEGFPEDLSGLATSLRIEAGREVGRERVLAGLLRGLEEELAGLEAGWSARADEEEAGEVGLLQRFQAASTWVRGRRVRVGEGPDSYTGVTAGLDRDGFLLVDSTASAGPATSVRHTVLSGGVRDLA